MLKAKEGDTVNISYSIKTADGTMFESTTTREPLLFKIGETEIMPGFQQAIVGMRPGENKVVKVPAAEAYGTYQNDLVLDINSKLFPSDIDPRVGQFVELLGEEGKSTQFMVTDVTKSRITLDANHRLAGKDLIVEIHLIEII